MEAVIACLKAYKKVVGATGFEPATSGSQSQRSSQAELHPVHGEGNITALLVGFVNTFCFFSEIALLFPAAGV